MQDEVAGATTLYENLQLDSEYPPTKNSFAKKHLFPLPSQFRHPVDFCLRFW